jgi:FG-GAP-like repeat
MKNKSQKIFLIILGISSIFVMKSSLAAPMGADRGWSDLPKWMVDVNADGKPDFCRFVGNQPKVFLSCHLATNDGFDPNNQFTFNSGVGIDKGYNDMPRSMRDVNGDGRADFCRWVGNAPNIYESCLLAGQTGFTKTEYRLDR